MVKSENAVIFRVRFVREFCGHTGEVVLVVVEELSLKASQTDFRGTEFTLILRGGR